MAKTSIIERELKRERLIAKYSKKRQAIKAIIHDPKASAEEIGYTFLPCILAYLHKAPDLIPIENTNTITGIFPNMKFNRKNILMNNDVDAVVVPASALGGSAVLSFIALGKLVIAIEENNTCMKTTMADLNLQSSTNIIPVRSYFEAVGVLAAHKAGINLQSISSQLDPVPVTFL